MNIIVSACLLGEKCKYNGDDNYCEPLCDALKGHTVIPVCPEVKGGLPCPRPPAEIIGERVMTADGTDVTSYFANGIQLTLEAIDLSDIDYAILQPRSPSCGIDKIYDGTFSDRLIPGTGLFAQALKANGIDVISAYQYKDLLL